MFPKGAIADCCDPFSTPLHIQNSLLHFHFPIVSNQGDEIAQKALNMDQENTTQQDHRFHPAFANVRVFSMKTNSLGQFITTSAIEENGTYVIELSKNGFTFGRYEVELKGAILPTYEFIAE